MSEKIIENIYYDLENVTHLRACKTIWFKPGKFANLHARNRLSFGTLKNFINHRNKCLKRKSNILVLTDMYKPLATNLLMDICKDIEQFKLASSDKVTTFECDDYSLLLRKVTMHAYDVDYYMRSRAVSNVDMLIFVLSNSQNDMDISFSHIAEAYKINRIVVLDNRTKPKNPIPDYFNICRMYRYQNETNKTFEEVYNG